VGAQQQGMPLTNHRTWAWMVAQSGLLPPLMEAQFWTQFHSEGTSARACVDRAGIWECRIVLPQRPDPAIEPSGSTGAMLSAVDCRCSTPPLDPTGWLSERVALDRYQDGHSTAQAWTRLQATLHAPEAPGERRRMHLRGWACVLRPTVLDAAPVCPALDATSVVHGLATRHSRGGTPGAVVRTWQNQWHQAAGAPQGTAWVETIGQWRPGW
jgi:hypothetical protein